MLSDMIVQTISVANIPLAQKAEFYSALNHVAIVSDNVKKVLEQSINASQEEVIVQETINEEIKSDLNEV
ncbi:MAG: hypothetical protein EOM19_08585 [Candidatus Moranbacteria bacterium]|nr:hypothetical protein [Candidatus Moranbacteria bacterium]